MESWTFDYEPSPSIAVPTHTAPSTPDATREVGLFWDYQNLALPCYQDAATASNRLREISLCYGNLVERRVYSDPEETNRVQASNRSQLDMAGFTLIDCPSRNMKETVDKKIIVDVMCFALARVARQQPACVVLLTNDGDYACAPLPDAKTPGDFRTHLR